MSIPKPLKYIIITALALFGLVIVLVGVIYSTSQISADKANKKCSELFDEVKADITNTERYTVVDGSKNCEPMRDEMGFTDYKLSAHFRVTTDGLGNEDGLKSSMKNLADILPKRDYPISIQNIPAKTEQPAVCVSASRYLDNDGKDVQQGPLKHSYSYSDLGIRENSSACK